MSSERYEILQDDLDSLLERLDASLEWLTKKSTNPNEVRSGLARCQGQVDEARKYLRDMEQEARGAPLAYKSEMLSKVRTYRETVANVQSEVRRRETELTRDRLYRGVPTEAPEESHEEQIRSQIMRGAAVLDQTSQSIQRSTQVAHETEEVGDAIMNDLGVQRETLERARTMLGETEAELSRSRRIIKRLSRSTIYNKMVLIVIIIIELLIIIALVYWKWFSKK